MRLPDNLTPEQDAVLVACFRMFAAHGKAIRLQREQAEKENHPERGQSGDSQDDCAKMVGSISYAPKV